MTASERLEQIATHGVDLAKRRIYLHGDVDGTMTARLLAALHLMDEEDKLITVFLDTGGGDEYEAWAMYDAMHLARSRIMVIGLGQVMSAGAIILNGASEGLRCLTRNCRFMIHNGQGDFSSVPQPHSSVVKAMGKEQEINDNRYAFMLAERADKGLDVQRMCLNETYMSAEDTVRLGFADLIVDPKAYRYHIYKGKGKNYVRIR